MAPSAAPPKVSKSEPAAAHKTGRAVLSRLSLRQLEGFLLAASESAAAGLTLQSFARGAGGAMLPAKLGTRFAEHIEAGESFVDFLDELGLPESRDAAILRAAEKRGELPAALSALASLVESRRKARGRLIAQLTYPALLFVAYLAIEPLALLVLKGPGAYFGQVMPRLVPLLLLIGLGPYFATRLRGDSALIRLALVPFSVVPPFAGIARRRAKAAFAEVLGASLRVGLPLYEALDLAGGAAQHPVFRRELDTARSSIERGAHLYVAIERLPFSREERAWIQHGEETGHLDAALTRVADENRNRAKVLLRILFFLLALAFAVFVLAKLLLGITAAYKGYFQMIDGILEPFTGSGSGVVLPPE